MPTKFKKAFEAKFLILYISTPSKLFTGEMTMMTSVNETYFLENCFLDARDYMDYSLRDQSPTLLVLTTAITIYALTVLKRCFELGWGQTRRQQLGNMALQIPYVKKKYQADIQKELVHFQSSVRSKWKKFFPLYKEIPDNGLDLDTLKALVDSISALTISGIQNKHLSGTIYSRSLLHHPASSSTNSCGAGSNVEDKLQEIFTYAFQRSFLWNSLHSDEFSIGACIDYQVVRMVAKMFGGSPEKVMGFVTSGGTESLMLAIRAYRNWGMEHRGHKPGEGVVLASTSVHASIMKAGAAYLVKTVPIDTDKQGRIDLASLRKAVDAHGSKVIAIIGSAPSYPFGIIDPIAEMAEIASQNECGMHVDCCLGGFIINNLPIHTDYLCLRGVTSLSADTHKNGMAPKGSSVLVTQKLGERNLAYYSIYSIPGWIGGVYGSPKDAGSQSCVQSLNAFLAMLGTGKNGYRENANRIHTATLALAEIIKNFEGRLLLITEPKVNVVAFKIDPTWGLPKGASYAFAHEMAKRNVTLNTLSGDNLHFCVTARFAEDQKGLDYFRQAATQSLTSVKELNDTLLKEGKKFSGDAGMYCALESAMTPDIQTLSTQKYFENLILGQKGAEDAVKAYFLAQLDPYAS